MATLRFPKHARDRIVADVRADLEDWHRRTDSSAPVQALCLWWAYFTTLRVSREGVRCIVQAGEAFWPCVTREQAEAEAAGDIPGGHFWGYGFAPETIEAKIAAKELPEMHVWAAIPAFNEIVDVTTCFWPEQCKALKGREWTAPRPPDYFWHNVGNPAPYGVWYHAHPLACQVAESIIRHSPVLRPK